MNLDKVFAIAGSIVTVALVWVVVSNANSANVIGSFGNAFATAVKSASGR